MIADAPPDPFSLFARWFAEAEASEPADPNAMSVATRLRASGFGSSMNEPPYFTTNVEPRKSWM